MRWVSSVIFSATLVLAGSSFSTDASALLGAHACVSAVKASCGHVKPQVKPLRACFETHVDHLSGTCASRLSQVADLAKECEADVRNLCGGVQRRQRLWIASSRGSARSASDARTRWRRSPSHSPSSGEPRRDRELGRQEAILPGRICSVEH
jgi:hypothetical protein